MFRDSQLIINLDNLAHNVNSIKSYCKNTTLGAVLKANAYGHGLKPMAKALYDLDVNYFLVATLPEGIALRKENPNYIIQIMGHTPNQYLKALVEHQLIPTIFSLEQATLLNELTQQPIDVHLKIETGFNRLGMQINDQTVEEIKNIHALDHIRIKGAFSHLSLMDKASDTLQFNRFKELMSTLETYNIHIPVQHICDSIGMVFYPAFHMDMVRIGALLYGLESEEKGTLDIRPILSFQSKLSHVKIINKGERVAYGNRYIASENVYIGTLPFGYADGYPRSLTNKGYVYINTVKYPIVGAICMDQCMIASKTPLNKDDIVEIIGEHIPVQTLADLACTNKNEIVAQLANRLPRVYIKNNQIVHIENGLIE